MQKSNNSLSISPTEQMYALNRINEINRPINASNSFTYGGLGGMNGVEDLIVDAGKGAIALIKKIGGLFTKDPNRDIHIPAQNAAVTGTQNVLSALDAKASQGMLTQNDVANGASQILAIRDQFSALCDQLSRQYPSNASRYAAGKAEVSALLTNIAGGNNLFNSYAGKYTQSGVISSAINSVSNLFTGGGGSRGSSLTPALLLSAAFFIVPKLLKRF